MTTPNPEQWDNIPEELKWLRQWLIAGPNELGEFKVPHSIKANGSHYKASNTSPEQWLDFETACEAARVRGWAIGFVLTAKDQYTVVDLDVKNAINAPGKPELWTAQPDIERMWSIAQMFNSFTERSGSKQGLHIWLRGNIGKGLKRGGVELYSQERFIVCTGDVLFNTGIEVRDELLGNMAKQMESVGATGISLEELEEAEPDEILMERAMGASNGDKFNALCRCTSDSAPKALDGSYVELGYKSQSEADLALMSIFTFYSKSNEQCRRLFRMTGLGMREKATKDDRYLNETLKRIRARQYAQEKLDDNARAMAMSLVQELQMRQMNVAVPPAGVDAGYNGTPILDQGPGLPWPPGATGALAQYIFNSSARPVKEVSIVAALGLLAGICGKSFNIPQSGLNLYIILIARSAVGKEAMHGGISNILSQMRDCAPTAHHFVDFNDFASGPALVKACASQSSFVNVAGEWGRKLERLSREDGRDAAMQQLRTVMTNLYQKSGSTSVVGGLNYSNKEQNIASVNGVAFSMIGESTPQTFYDSLTESMMSDGFLSRFTVIEYNGTRPALNNNPVLLLTKEMKDWLAGLAQYASQIMATNNGPVHVMFEPTAKAMLDEFDRECDKEINSTDDESWRQMWNRAHLKVLRVSALLAVFDNYSVPTVFPQHVEWALNLIRRDIAMFMRRITAGDVGTGDHVRENKLLATMREYLEAPLAASYSVPEVMHKAGVIPRKVLQLRCARVTAFRTHRLGAVAAMDTALRSLADSGYIAEVDKTKQVTEYGYHGKCYRILNLPPADNRSKAPK